MGADSSPPLIVYSYCAHFVKGAGNKVGMAEKKHERLQVLNDTPTHEINQASYLPISGFLMT